MTIFFVCKRNVSLCKEKNFWKSATNQCCFERMVTGAKVSCEVSYNCCYCYWDDSWVFGIVSCHEDSKNLFDDDLVAPRCAHADDGTLQCKVLQWISGCSSELH